MPETISSHPRRWRRMIMTLVLVAGAALGAPAPSASAEYQVVSSVGGTDGKRFTATNHLTAAARTGGARSWLLTWAGAVDPAQPDFVAVIDTTPGSRSYGDVVNTVTLGPVTQNEPHHMQYIWHQGDNIFAAGIMSDTVFVLDTRHLPELRLAGVVQPQDTPCGSAPDAFWTLRDGTAYATYMGGPDVSGSCTYTDGTQRMGNGFAGSPGEIVHLSRNGRVISEIPAALPGGEDPELCHNIPAIEPATCANPHGVQAREDLNRMVVSDFAEVRNYLDPNTQQTDPFLLRSTVRFYDISNRRQPRLVSVTRVPDGPRVDPFPAFDENRMVMETSVTNRPGHKGAFASTMAGGSIFYTPDITVADPQWVQVFDDSAAYRTFDTTGILSGTNSGGSWLQVSPDDRFLFHGVMGSDPRLPRADNAGMVYVLDIRKLLASGRRVSCRIDTTPEITAGGADRDCPKLTGVVPIIDKVSPGVGVGPHWGAMDNFTLGRDGRWREAERVDRIATSNYFMAKTGIDGDHRVCMLNLTHAGRLSLDTAFRDEWTGESCVSFNRARWPHGKAGDARPHGVLFVVSDRHGRA